MMKRTGPRTEPRGTPEVTVVGLNVKDLSY